jgi:hypothetical protein
MTVSNQQVLTIPFDVYNSLDDLRRELARTLSKKGLVKIQQLGKDQIVEDQSVSAVNP